VYDIYEESRMSFAIRENGIIDEIIVEKIMLKLVEMRPLTNCCTSSEFKKAIALTRITDDDIRAIERFLSEKGLIKRSGRNIYFDGKFHLKKVETSKEEHVLNAGISSPKPMD
jgi:hypothetical protein